jgi:hypothetical protein
VELKDMLKGDPERVRLSEVTEVKKEKAKEEDVVQFYRYSADVGDAHAQVKFFSENFSHPWNIFSTPPNFSMSQKNISRGGGKI